MDTVCFFGANWPHLYISTVKHSLPSHDPHTDCRAPLYLHTFVAVPWFRSSLPWGLQPSVAEPLVGVAAVEAQADLQTGKALCRFLCVSKMLIMTWFPLVCMTAGPVLDRLLHWKLSWLQQRVPVISVAAPLHLSVTELPADYCCITVSGSLSGSQSLVLWEAAHWLGAAACAGLHYPKCQPCIKLFHTQNCSFMCFCFRGHR